MTPATWLKSSEDVLLQGFKHTSDSAFVPFSRASTELIKERSEGSRRMTFFIRWLKSGKFRQNSNSWIRLVRIQLHSQNTLACYCLKVQTWF